jgi:hypothetical protein
MDISPFGADSFWTGGCPAPQFKMLWDYQRA